MARPSYKQLFEEEKAKRAKVAEKTKKVMRENFDSARDAKARAALILENQDEDRQTMELIYLERIAELQAEVRRLQNKVEELSLDIELSKR